MRTSRLATLAMLVPAVLAGCASASGTSSGRNPDVISAEEMRQYPGYTALGMIRQFRPNWLNDRGGSINPLGVQDIANPRGIRVYVDGVEKPEGLAELERLSVQDIGEMRKLDSSDATQRFGLGHTSGAIVVETIGRQGAA